MSVPELITIKAAAREIGVPATELEASAREHGFLVLIGARTIRIERSSLIELVKECRENPKAHASTGGIAKGSGKASMSSEKAQKSIKREQSTAEKLKRRSTRTS